MSKILAGKPVYGSEDVGQSQPPAGGVPQPLVPTAPTGPKYIPQIDFGRVENLVKNGRLDMYFDIVNTSGEAVFIDRIALLGTRRELDSQLRPGERKQYCLYSGAPLTSQPNGYVELQYRKVSDGDYFKSFYVIRYERDEHGFHVTELRPSGPVKDI